jgi:hypothetical protein
MHPPGDLRVARGLAMLAWHLPTSSPLVLEKPYEAVAEFESTRTTYSECLSARRAKYCRGSWEHKQQFNGSSSV